MIIARCSITVSIQKDVDAVYRYYKLQSSTATPPTKPTSIGTLPPSGWNDTEPAYTEGSTNSLYTVDLTIFTDETFQYSEVSLSSSYEAAKTAYNKAATAVQTIEEYINPIVEKTWTGVTCTGNSDPAGWLYFGTVKPSGYYVPWKIRYKITYEIAGITDGRQVSEIIINGCKNTYYAYQVYNMISNTSYRPAYGHVLYTCTQAGITAGYGHLLGERFQSSYNPATAANARTITVEVAEAVNCTVELADSWFLYSAAPGTGTTNYATRTTFDGTTQGFTETGDRNETNHILNNFAGKTGAKGIWAGSLFMRDGNGTYQNVCTAADGTVTTASSGNGARTTAKTKLANTNGFEVGSGIFYTGTSYNLNANIGNVYASYGAFDSRYTINSELTANFLTPYTPIYFVGTIGSDGLFYLDTVWWTQTPTDTSKVYVLIGNVYDSSTSYCRFSLAEDNRWYKYDGTKLIDYSNNLAQLAQATANAKNAVFYQGTAPSTTGRKEYDVWFNTSDGNKMHYWNGTAWTLKQFGTNAIGESAITGSLIAGNTITGDHIVAHTITGMHIAAATIKAANIDVSDLFAQNITATGTITGGKFKGTATNSYIESATYSYSSGNYSSSGIHIDLSASGYIRAKNFAIDSSGNAYFKGRIEADSGTIGGWDITSTGINVSQVVSSVARYSGLTTGNNNSYIFYAGETNSKYGASDSDARFAVDRLGDVSGVDDKREYTLRPSGIQFSYIPNTVISSTTRETFLSAERLKLAGNYSLSTSYSEDSLILTYDELTFSSGDVTYLSAKKDGIDIRGKSASWLNAFKSETAIFVGSGTGTGLNSLATVMGSFGRWTQGVLETDDTYNIAYAKSSRTTNGFDYRLCLDPDGSAFLSGTEGSSFSVIATTNGATLAVRNNIRNVALHTNNQGTAGIYDTTNTDWIIRSDTNQNVLIPHQLSVTGQVIATGTITTSGNFISTNKNRGFYLMDADSNQYPAIFDNGANMWIGSPSSAGPHHRGGTFISAGYNGTSGNATINVSVPNASNTGATNYAVLHTGNQSSDIRLKKNVKDTEIKSAVAELEKIKIHAFDWIDHEEHQKIGFVADEIEEIDAKLVHGGGYDAEGGINIKWIDTFYMTGYIVKAIQELSARITTLEKGAV